VFKPGLAARAEELIDHVASRLAAYKKPRSVEVMERLPRNPSGKVLRRELRRGLARR
jgi:acyl-coenzyme A synthetase/AMP-(fatty) acid ligase